MSNIGRKQTEILKELRNTGNSSWFCNEARENDSHCRPVELELFHGCDGDYDMKKTVFLLINKRTRVSFDFKSAKFVNLNDVQFSVGVTGQGSAVEAEFLLREIQKTRMLVQGKIRQCA